MSTTTAQQLEAARDAVGNVPLNHQSAFVNVMGLRSVMAEQESKFRFALTVHPAPTPLAIGNSTSHIFSQVRDDNEFLRVKAALEYAESLPEVQEALAIMEPLVAEVRRLEDKLAEEVAERGRIMNELREAEETARAKADAALAKDPAIIAARKALDALTPPVEPEAPALERESGLAAVVSAADRRKTTAA